MAHLWRAVCARSLALSLIGIVVATASAAQERSLVRERLSGVVELFTSQGCSSCPPADKLMAELAKDQSLLVLSLPVDYWDYLGWRDTLANPAFTARQRGYAAARGDRHVYTPQAVINGQVHAVGSQRADIDQAVRETGARSHTLQVLVAVDRSDGLRVRVSAAQGLPPGVVYLLSVTRSHTVKIGRGENTGRTVTYVNVVRSLKRLGDWTGAAVTFEVPAATLPAEADGYVVLLQAGSERKPGAILGAVRSLGL
jgi:hypothetical protein